MANGKTKTNDKGYNRILSDLAKVNGAEVSVGILKGTASVVDPSPGSGTKKRIEVAQIAAVQEFGTTRAGAGNTVTIPERPFLRSNFDDRKGKYRLVLRSLYADILAGRASVESALSLFGERVVGDVKRKITSIRVPKNAPSTQKIKGFDNPLIRTGTLRARISKRVKL